MSSRDDKRPDDAVGTEGAGPLAGSEYTDEMHDGEAQADDRNGATEGTDGESEPPA